MNSATYTGRLKPSSSGSASSMNRAALEPDLNFVKTFLGGFDISRADIATCESAAGFDGGYRGCAAAEERIDYQVTSVAVLLH